MNNELSMQPDHVIDALMKNRKGVIRHDCGKHPASTGLSVISRFILRTLTDTQYKKTD